VLVCLRGVDQAGEITGTGASVSLSTGVRESEIKRRTKHVAAPIDRFPDRSSILLTSTTLFMQFGVFGENKPKTPFL